MAHPLQDLVGTINDQLLGDKGIRELFNVVGRTDLTQHCDDTTLHMFQWRGNFLVNLRNSANGAFIRLSGDLRDASVDTLIKYEGSEDDVRSMVNDMVTNFRPIKVSRG